MQIAGPTRLTPSGCRRMGVASLCLFLGLLARASADELNEAAKELQAKRSAEVEKLAEWCQQRGLIEQARQTRALLGPRDPYKLYLPVLPSDIGTAKPPSDAPADRQQWQQQFLRLRREQANALYDLARRAVRTRRASLAFELALAAIRANPDHQAARRLMGYQQYRDRWHTTYEVRKLRSGQVWHEKFGWLPKSHVSRYEQGQRLVGGRWIAAEEDARRRRDIHSGWNIQTEHYSIVTNHSLESGVRLGVKLEGLFRIWRQLFLPYYASEAQVIALFDGRTRGRRTPTRRFHVVFFRDQADYNRSLRAAIPDIHKSIGLYLEEMGRAYFFAGDDYTDRTLYHEATHQLFHQSRPVAANVGGTANFWIAEGIALYMESLRQEGHYWVLGGYDDARLHAARYRLLEDNFYVPLEEFTTFGREDFQRHERMATLYSQAAGLTHFLVHYDAGRYRDALIAYLRAVYSGRATPRTLADLTGSTYRDLDAQYRRFVEESVRVQDAQ